MNLIGGIWMTHRELAASRPHWNERDCRGRLTFTEHDGAIAVAECDACGLVVGVTPTQQLAWLDRTASLAREAARA